jgi:hypothetical protein
MWNMHYSVDFKYQLSITYRTEENHGSPWSSWQVVGNSGCKLNFSQQSGIKYTDPNFSPYLDIALFEKIYKKDLRITKLI